MNSNLNIIVCIAKNRAIGRNNQLLYHLRNDLKRFKALTTGHTVIMGRRTFESLPKGALPNRRNIVLTHSSQQWPNTEVYTSLDEALKHCSDNEEVFIIGGSSVYHEALPLAHKLFLTLVDHSPNDADTFFPAIGNEWIETERESHLADEQNEQPYSLITMVKQNAK